jgi:hypothetical protein
VSVTRLLRPHTKNTLQWPDLQGILRKDLELVSGKMLLVPAQPAWAVAGRRFQTLRMSAVLATAASQRDRGFDEELAVAVLPRDLAGSGFWPGGAAAGYPSTLVARSVLRNLP